MARRSHLAALFSLALAVGCKQILGIGDVDFSSTSASSGAGGATTSSSGVGGSTTSTSGTGGATTSTGGTGGATTSASGTGGTGGTGGGGGCTLDHLVISEIRTRGLDGSDDEFVELYNPTSKPIKLDATWTLQGRKADVFPSATIRWTGAGGTIPAKGHFLIAGNGYSQSPARDEPLSTALTDAMGLTLYSGSTQIDSVCFYYDNVTLQNEQFFTFPCEGMPVLNPHDDTAATNKDESVERKPGGALGNCTDTEMNDADFAVTKPATPRNSQSAPTP
jgi:hypothetical protein